MSLAELPSGTSIFIDANIFIYHYDYCVHTHKIERMGISIQSFFQTTVIRSHNHRLRYGLMVNDSLILALMEEAGLTHLASKDKSFLGMKEIKVVCPQDLQL